MEELIAKIVEKTRELCKDTQELSGIADTVARRAYVKIVETDTPGKFKIQNIKFIGTWSKVEVTETDMYYKRDDEPYAHILHSYKDWDAFLNLKEI